MARDVGSVPAVAQLLRDTVLPPDDDPTAGEGEPPKPLAVADEGQADEGAPGLSEEGLGMELDDGGDAGITDTLQSLAEKSGLTLEALYATEVALGDGRDPTTLGALKDQFQDYSRLVEKTEAFDEQRLEFENNMIRSRGELQEIVKLLPPGAVTDELIAEAGRTFAETRERELTSLIKVKPEWKDPAAYALAQDQILETASEYGFNRADLQAVLDHRLIKLLHDFHTMRTRFKEANASVKRVVNASRNKRPARRQGAPSTELKNQIEAATTGGSTQQKAAAIAALIGRRS